MVYLKDWETFYAESEKLYLEHPAHTRYVMKYRHCDGKLVLKVTNDRVVLKYETDQATDLKRFEKLNNLFFAHMCGLDPNREATDDGKSERPVSSEQKPQRPISSEQEGDRSASAKKRKGKR